MNRGAVEGPRGGVAAGAKVEGPRGNTAAAGAAEGPRGGTAAGARVSGPRGNTAAAGAAVGPRGNAAGFGRVSGTNRTVTGAAVRGNFHDWGVYGRGWYGTHPGAWYAAGWGARDAWAWASWASLGGWFGYGANYAPIYYDYGNNVTYDNSNVYMNGQDAGTSADYYQQASSLADTGTEAEASADEEWLPLGVFALSHLGHHESKVAIQLAVDKQGVIRGNYTDTFTDHIMPVHGSVDKEQQRVAFTVGDKKSTVFETGLYNLTKDEAPLLIHFGQDRTEQWLLVRLKQPDDQKTEADDQATEQPEQP